VAEPEPPRETYHHGQLGPALVQAGLTLARSGGAQAIVLREATRMAGVTPRAAYRHFSSREALVDAVAAAALGKMAEVIERHQTVVPADTAAEEALGRLCAVGRGYLEFALTEPGWFDVAFFTPADLAPASAPDAVGASGRTPYQQLGDALDAMVAAGVMAPERRLGGDVFCWSAVHGFAVLATRGPLRSLPAHERAQVAHLVVDLAVRGVAALPEAEGSRA
jgi:AcrR family transcriptional regulator